MGNDIIVVIGMARSGTSLACQVLEALGVSFGPPGQLVGSTNFNERGHYDHVPTHTINIRLLERLFNIPWLFLGELPQRWETWESVKQYHDQAVACTRIGIAYAREHSPLGLFGLKDPRITRMRGFWEDVFAELAVKPRYVLCWRHPEHVYMSCHPRTMRDVRPKETTFVEETVEEKTFWQPECPTTHRPDIYAIWAHFMADGFEARPEAVVKYDNWFVRGYGEKQAEALASLVGAEPLDSATLDKIIDPGLRHYGA